MIFPSMFIRLSASFRPEPTEFERSAARTRRLYFSEKNSDQYRAVADARERAENRPNARLVSEHWLEGGELKSRAVNIPVHVDDDLARYLWRDQRRARRRKLDAWDLHFGPTVYLLAAAVVGLVMIFGYVLISSIWGQL